MPKFSPNGGVVSNPFPAFHSSGGPGARSASGEAHSEPDNLTQASPAYRYWRLVFADSASGTRLEIAELELRKLIHGADITTASTTITSTSDTETVGREVDKVLDGDAATYYESTDTELPLTITIDFGADNSQFLRQLALTAQASDAAHAPNAFVVEGSADNSAWTRHINAASSTFTAGSTVLYEFSREAVA